jgi:hypothetical protein
MHNTEVNRMFRRFDADSVSSDIITTPNMMSLGRTIGGVAVGIEVARGQLSPEATLTWMALLGASDGEGNLIHAFRQRQNPVPAIDYARERLKIVASKTGARLDHVADKIMGISYALGATYGGMIDQWQGIGILTTEVSTACLASYADRAGVEPKVKNVGKIGMLGRIAAFTGAAASRVDMPEPAKRILEVCTAIAATGSMVCGTLVIKDLRQQISQHRESQDSITKVI